MCPAGHKTHLFLQNRTEQSMAPFSWARESLLAKNGHPPIVQKWGYGRNGVSLRELCQSHYLVEYIEQKIMANVLHTAGNTMSLFLIPLFSDTSTYTAMNMFLMNMFL